MRFIKPTGGRKGASWKRDLCLHTEKATGYVQELPHDRVEM